MSVENSFRTIVAPPLPGIPRPLWSVMIPTFNCAEYLRETLASVLGQDPGTGTMQIAVVDDCSTQDDPKAVVDELGLGRVEFYQQPENVGYIGNFATCLRLSRGHLIHLLHGDDTVLDGFYQKMQALFEAYPEIGAGFCRQVLTDECGHWKYFSIVEKPEPGVLDDWLVRIATELTLQTPSMVVRREVYEQLGGFDCRMLSCGEDWEMWCRIAANYSVGYEPEVLAAYRDRSGSLTKRSIRTGQNIRDVACAADIVKDYLPESAANKIYKKARKKWSLWGLSIAEQLIDKGDREAAIRQIFESVKCSLSINFIQGSVRPLLKLIKS